jgi:hypothetical protein
LHLVNNQYNLTTYEGSKPLSNFIIKARKGYGIKQIGGSGECFPFFRDVLNVYNKMHPDSLQKFDVFNLEFEFWVPSVVKRAYCDLYLKPGGYACDTAGAFSFYLKTLHSVDSLAHLSGTLCETYIGWPTPGQAVQIGNSCDRILLYAYVQTDSDVYSYLQRRLHYFEPCSKKVVLLPIFSAEGGKSNCGSNAFMGTWLNSHPETQAYATFMRNFNLSFGGAWKQNISIQGYQWFDYSCLTTNSNPGLKRIK